MKPINQLNESNSIKRNCQNLPNTAPPSGIFDVHPIPCANTRVMMVGVGTFSRRLRGLKLVPSKWRCLVPPGCRLAKPCRDTPALIRVLRNGYPAESMRGLRTPLGGRTINSIEWRLV
jgi:hypothetical protein